MGVETIVSDVKGAVEPYMVKGKDVVTLSYETLKQANTVVVEGVQELFKANVDAGKDLFAAAQTSFEKARTDGLKAVAAKPIEYIPDGRDVVIAAYNDSFSIVTKTGEELFSVVKKGYGDVTAKLTGSTTVSGEVKKAQSTVRKTAKRATSAAKKAAAQ